MKNQALFSSKDKRKKLNCRLLQFLFGALRVNSAHKKSITRYRMFSFFFIFAGLVFHTILQRNLFVFFRTTE